MKKWFRYRSRGSAAMPTKHHWEVVVHNEITTLKKVVGGCSIARFGDGELKFALGSAMRFQTPTEGLHFRMLQVLRSRVPGLLIGVPYQSDDRLKLLKGKLTEKDIARWIDFRLKLNALWDPTLEYYTAFITRPDNCVLEDFTEFYELWLSVWRGRKVVAVQSGERPFARDDVLFGHVSLEIVTVPPEQAWFEYERILAACMTFPKDRLFLMAAGPTATVLAHDLHVAGYQAVDVGHLWRWPPQIVGSAVSEQTSKSTLASESTGT